MKTNIKTMTKTKTKVPRPPPGEREEPTLGIVLVRTKEPKEAISDVRPSVGGTRRTDGNEQLIDPKAEVQVSKNDRGEKEGKEEGSGRIATARTTRCRTVAG